MRYIIIGAGAVGGTIGGRLAGAGCEVVLVARGAQRAALAGHGLRLKVPDVNTDPDGGVCTECFNDFGANIVLTNDWKLYSFPFKSMKQLPDWGAPKKPHITPSKLYGVQFQVNVPRAAYDIYIDDLKFFCE